MELCITKHLHWFLLFGVWVNIFHGFCPLQIRFSQDGRHDPRIPRGICSGCPYHCEESLGAKYRLVARRFFLQLSQGGTASSRASGESEFEIQEACSPYLGSFQDEGFHCFFGWIFHGKVREDTKCPWSIGALWKFWGGPGARKLKQMKRAQKADLSVLQNGDDGDDGDGEEWDLRSIMRWIKSQGRNYRTTLFSFSCWYAGEMHVMRIL